MPKKTPAYVLFNASVVLAGLKSPTGGSGELLKWVKQRKIRGIISETIFDEVLRNAERIGFTKQQAEKSTNDTFIQILQAPEEKIVERFKEKVLDLGDAHVLASAKEEGVQFLVTLDKKHLLVLKDKIKTFKIVSSGQLIGLLR